MQSIVVDVVEPSRSRRSMRAAWSLAKSEEEARAHLQSRLTFLFKLMFWSFVALVAFLWLLYHRYPDIEPRLQKYVYAMATGGLALMAFMWRGVLLRRTQLALTTLEAIDLVYAIGSGAILTGAAVISYERPISAYSNLTYMCIVVLTRALVVPSTGMRTALTSGLAFAPMAIASFILPFLHTQEVQPPAFVIGFFMCAAVAVLLASAGSRIIYGLRKQVNEAMQLGEYTLGDLISKGGMGEVYRGQHALLRRPTAIKLMRADKLGADYLERFVREVELTSRLTHPSAVAVFDYGHSAEGGFYYVMEYLGGGIDLGRLVREHGPQPSGRVVGILVQALGALAEAHEHGFSHRDIKPENIILCERGLIPDVPKVVDFGLAKEITKEIGASAQVILATPGYVAPEVITDASTGPSADLYALGAVGYYLVTGRAVFEGTVGEVLKQHLTAEPRPPSELASLSPGLEAVILRCLQKRPADRYESATALADALRALPVDPDWDTTRARAWWREHRPAEPKPSNRVPTTQITVDLGERVTS
jgi:serine/threonine-protein kinase